MLEIASAAATVEGKAANVVQPPQKMWSSRCNELDYFPNSATIHNERLWLSRQHFLLAEVMKPRPVQTYQSVAMDSLSLRNVLLSSLTRLVIAFSTS